MTIQINTDNHIEGSEKMETYYKDSLEHGLKNFSQYITRLEVHVSDQNADKEGPDDIQCRIEARVQGKEPVLVENRGENQEVALHGAIDKLQGVMRKIKDKFTEH